MRLAQDDLFFAAIFAAASAFEDGERAARALKGITGKRLTYRLAH
jgi:hypothetical protein